MNSKIVSLETLKKINKNKKIVLVHGVFDVFHLGHKRHLDIASKYADILVVSITTDKFVNKGPGRPVFKQDHRAELIASLAVVDFVYINDDETPINIIKTIKPSFYVKGNDYKNLKKDFTGNILKEKKAVESNNGSIIFTNEIEFSSSSIINNYIQPSKIIGEIKNSKSSLKKLKLNCFKSLNEIKKLKVAVIGEIIIDEYIFTQEMDKPSKENINAVSYGDKKEYFGGSFAIANQIAEYVKNVDLYSAGNFNKNLMNKLKNKKHKNISKINIVCNLFKSIKKSRYLNSSGRKLFEVYYRKGEKNLSNTKKFMNLLAKNIKKYDLIIIADYGHGFFNNELIKYLTNLKKIIAVNTQTNSDNRGFNLITKYNRANIVCLDEVELKLAMKNKVKNINELVKILYENIKTENIIVTLGKKGIFISNKNKKNFQLTGFETNPVDTMGAGDAVFGLGSVLFQVKTDLKVICFLCNLIGALKTRILGHSKIVEKKELLKAINYSLK